MSLDYLHISFARFQFAVFLFQKLFHFMLERFVLFPVDFFVLSSRILVRFRSHPGSLIHDCRPYDFLSAVSQGTGIF